MKRILILNGTISEIPIIKKAQEMGYYVITTGNMSELPGHQLSDKYIEADYSNEHEILRLVKENDIEGIISCANDFGSITASYVGEQMGWKGHDTYANALLMHRKDKLMDYFKRKGVPAPWYEIFDDANKAKSFCKMQKCVFPIMVKANDLTGGKGILRADNYGEACKAIDQAFTVSRDKHVLIEPYLKGVQQSIVVFLIDRKIAITSSSDIYCMRNPYLVQAETYPATDFKRVEPKLHQIIEDMAQDLQLVDGIFSFQYIVENGVPYIIDMMRRNFGNETLLMADEMTGFPWEEAYIRASLGLPCKGLDCNKNQTKYCGHYGVMAEKNGVFEKYILPQTILDHVFKITDNMKKGDAINNYLTQKIAHIYFKYDDFDLMKREVLRYNQLVYIEMGNGK